MIMSLLAQAAIHMHLKRIGALVSSWNSKHFANDVLKGLDGDARLKHDMIMVTYYNAPNSKLLKKHYDELPKELEDEGVVAEIPWPYDFKIDFRFK